MEAVAAITSFRFNLIHSSRTRQLKFHKQDCKCPHFLVCSSKGQTSLECSSNSRDNNSNSISLLQGSNQTIRLQSYSKIPPLHSKILLLHSNSKIILHSRMRLLLCSSKMRDRVEIKAPRSNRWMMEKHLDSQLTTAMIEIKLANLMALSLK